MEDCSICYEEITVISKTKLDCGHSFHQDCLDKWYINSPTCPLCRSQIPTKTTTRFQVIYICTLIFKFIEKYYPELNFTQNVQNIIENKNYCYDECEQELSRLISRSKTIVNQNCVIILFRILSVGIRSV